MVKPSCGVINPVLKISMELGLVLSLLAGIFSFGGAVIMVISGMVSLVRFLRSDPLSIEAKEIGLIEKIRLGLGHKIIFGLEFLIIADVLRTLVNPTREDLIKLGGIVLIRTVLSYFISRELHQFHRDGRA